MKPYDCPHLLAVVDALVRRGNALVTDGFVPSQGDPWCGLRDPINFGVVRGIADDEIVGRPADDRVHCRHCRAEIVGGDAQRRAREHYAALARARERADG